MSKDVKQIISLLLDIKYSIGGQSMIKDAEFTFENGQYHYEKHKKDNELPKGMTYEDYIKKARDVSLKSINGTTVSAYKYEGNRIAKTDGQWFVSYVGGKGGKLVTAFPLRGGYNRFYRLMDDWYGTEIRKE